MNTKDQILELVMEENPANPVAYAHGIVQEYSRQKLDKYILGSNECGICKCGIGSGPKSLTKGNSNASVMIIGEAVSKEQADRGEKCVYPLDDESGIILGKVLDNLNVNHEELFYINTVSCWPCKVVGNETIKRTPTKAEVENCSVFVNYAIDIVKPQVIILLGNIALNAFKREAITKARGQWMEIRGIPTMPTYHPGYFIEIEGKKDAEIIEVTKWEFYEDVKKAFAYIQETYPDNNVLLAPMQKE